MTYLDRYGDLRDVLQTCKEKNFTLSYLEQVNITRQLCDGMVFLASKRYIHMDIAARNCLLAGKNKAKLADFGLTQRLDEGKDTYKLRKTAKLPVRWIAIESLKTGIFSEKSDVWAFGVLMWEVLAYGRTPFERIENTKVQAHVNGGGRLSLPRGGQSAYFDLAVKCWALPSKNRPNFRNILEGLDKLIPDAARVSGPERDIGAEIAAIPSACAYSSSNGNCLAVASIGTWCERHACQGQPGRTCDQSKASSDALCKKCAK